MIQKIEKKGVDYQLFLKTIQGFSHVEVHETICEELFYKADLYNVVVVVGHQVNGSIEKADGSLFPMNKIAQALPPQFNGYLHVAVCGSSSIRDEIKLRCPDCRVRTSNKVTQLELQILIYSKLLSRTDLCKETFDDWYESHRDCIKEIQKRKNPAELTKLPCATKLGEPTTDPIPSVYSPEYVIPGYKFKIQIFLHYDTEKGIVHDIAIGRDHETEPHLIPETLKGIRKGDEVEIKLSMQDAKGIPTNHIKIFGKECSYSEIVTISDKFVKKEFDVIVCEKYLSEVFWAVVEFIKDGKSIIEPYDYKISIKQESSQKINIAKLVDAIEGGHKDFAKASNTRITDNGIDTKGQYETTEKPEKKDENLSIDIILKRAVEEIKKDKDFKYKYDYAFIMNIINETERLKLKGLPTIDLPHFNTPQSFLIYLDELGIYDLPKADSIKKKLSSIQNNIHPWTFRDEKGKDITETNRRNSVAKKFLSIVINIIKSYSGKY